MVHFFVLVNTLPNSKAEMIKKLVLVNISAKFIIKARVMPELASIYFDHYHTLQNGLKECRRTGVSLEMSSLVVHVCADRTQRESAATGIN